VFDSFFLLEPHSLILLELVPLLFSLSLTPIFPCTFPLHPPQVPQPQPAPPELRRLFIEPEWDAAVGNVLLKGMRSLAWGGRVRGGSWPILP
jgi:hypothetical protein